ncbi:MAG: hypothetical protein MUF51_04810, partial [Vicinamibacteria bacterium]|nr:hypothetical protein [Vicinamibacteria bacterium]
RQKLLVNTRLQLSIRIPPSLQKHFGGKAVWETSATVIRLEAMEGQTTVRAGARFIEEAAAIRSSPRKA